MRTSRSRGIIHLIHPANFGANRYKPNSHGATMVVSPSNFDFRQSSLNFPMDMRCRLSGVFFLILFSEGLGSSNLRAEDQIHAARLEDRILRDQIRPEDPGFIPLSYSSAVRKVRDSVVTVLVKRERMHDPLGFDRSEEDAVSEFDLIPKRDRNLPGEFEDHDGDEGSGTGFFITPDGLFLTNHHVIDHAEQIRVRLRGEETTLEARLVGSDAATDLALLDVEGVNYSPATLGDSSACETGDVVLAVGSPFGLEQTVTMGVVSATGRGAVGILKSGFEDFIQTDAAINVPIGNPPALPGRLSEFDFCGSLPG